MIPQRGDVGMEVEAKPHVKSFTMRKGDRLLLCTDGLTDMLKDEQIAKVLREEQEPQVVCDKFVQMAKEAGGHDNITAVVVDCLG